MQSSVKKFLFLSLVAIFVASFASCSRPGAVEAGKDVAAAVNGKKIMLSEVDLIVSQQTRGQQNQLSPLELAAVRMQVLSTLIQQEVLFQRAEREKQLPTEDDITQAVNAQKQQGKLTEEEYQKQLMDANQTEASYREVVRKQMAIQKLQEKIATNIKISDKEVEDFYNNNKGQFVNARGVGLSAIIVDPADNGFQDDAKSEAEAKTKIDIISKQLNNRADFATIARARSEDQSNVNGGDIGFATEDKLKQNGFPETLVTRFFGPAQVGDITEPIKMSNGRWALFKLTAKRLQNENLTIDSSGVRDQIKTGLINQRRSMLNAALLELATNEARITNYIAQNMINSPNNLSGPRMAVRPSNTPALSPTQSPSTASPSPPPSAAPVATRPTQSP
ncbi:MAG: SurA N-terminal domain-containing protein [Pyrinomonadaceae bacterium]